MLITHMPQNKYTGHISITPALSPQEFEFLQLYWQQLKEFKENQNKTKISDFLGFTPNSKQGWALYNAYSSNITITPDSLQTLPIYTSQSALKPSIEAMMYFIFKEALIVRLRGIDFFTPHKLKGMINGQSESGEKWQYIVKGNKVLNIEAGTTTHRPRFKPEYFNSVIELANLNASIPVSKTAAAPPVMKI